MFSKTEAAADAGYSSISELFFRENQSIENHVEKDACSAGAGGEEAV